MLGSCWTCCGTCGLKTFPFMVSVSHLLPFHTLFPYDSNCLHRLVRRSCLLLDVRWDWQVPRRRSRIGPKSFLTVKIRLPNFLTRLLKDMNSEGILHLSPGPSIQDVNTDFKLCPGTEMLLCPAAHMKYEPFASLSWDFEVWWLSICQPLARIPNVHGNFFLRGDPVPSILSKMHKMQRARIDSLESSPACCLYIASEFKAYLPTPPFSVQTYPHGIHPRNLWLYGLWDDIYWTS